MSLQLKRPPSSSSLSGKSDHSSTFSPQYNDSTSAYSLLSINDKTSLDLNTILTLQELAAGSKLACDVVLDIAMQMGYVDYEQQDELIYQLGQYAAERLQYEFESNINKPHRGRPSMASARNELIVQTIEHEFEKSFQFPVSLNEYNGDNNNNDNNKRHNKRSINWWKVVAIALFAIIVQLIYMLQLKKSDIEMIESINTICYYKLERIGNFTGKQLLHKFM